MQTNNENQEKSCRFFFVCASFCHFLYPFPPTSLSSSIFHSLINDNNFLSLILQRIFYKQFQKTKRFYEKIGRKSTLCNACMPCELTREQTANNISNIQPTRCEWMPMPIYFRGMHGVRASRTAHATYTHYVHGYTYQKYPNA